MIGEKVRKLGLRIALSLLGLGVLILIYLSFLPQPEVESVLTGEEGLNLRQACYEGWDGQERLWRLEAAEIYELKGERNLYFAGLEKIEFFQGGEPSLTLTAEEAELRQKEKLLLIKQVRGELQEGEFMTAEVYVDTETRKVTCPQKVTFVKAELRVEANRMEGDLKSEEYLFTGDLQVEQKNSRSRGEVFRYWAQEDRFAIEGGVEVELEL
ncbi:MAG: LPS export ABC transporter periplasmic protein LptC [Firmicutes bacterium]|nr:LPS export ABC transporter periplasmic protein LptC [Bacillota bacterium]